MASINQVEAVIADIKTLWAATVKQGEGLQKLENLTTRIRDAVNNQANGVRSLETRVAQLEAVLMRVAQGSARPAQQAPMRSVNRAPLRALPSVAPRHDFVEVDDASADADYDYEEEDVG